MEALSGEFIVALPLPYADDLVVTAESGWSN